MSAILKMLELFPRGRTIEELLILVGAGYQHNKRVSVLAEIDHLLRSGRIRKDSSGRLFGVVARSQLSAPVDSTLIKDETHNLHEAIIATPARFSLAPYVESKLEAVDAQDKDLDVSALLRYWRSALRADPRGATTQVEDKHGYEWALITGAGPVVPEEDTVIQVHIELSNLPATFQEAITKRAGNENGLAIGWPIAVGRNGGVPVVRPVGLLAATWERIAEKLVLTIDSDDVMVNPDWVKEAARASGWSRNSLAELFHSDDGVGLAAADFLDKLRVSVASQIKGRISGEDLASSIDLTRQGIFDAAAIFLPTDSSFVAGCARDLDVIASWSKEQLSQTALGAVLGLKADVIDQMVPAINVRSLNKEQIRAVRGACEAPITVVTGPPGTGKSQAIVSMAASILASGGSVLVASKNHQALDAVEDRLGALAADCNFMVRTLNPKAEIDLGFFDILKILINDENSSRFNDVDELALLQLTDLAANRSRSLDSLDQIEAIELALTNVLERIERRAELEGSVFKSGSQLAPSIGASVLAWVRFVQWLVSFVRRSPKVSTKEEIQSLVGESLVGFSTAQLEALQVQLREKLNRLGAPEDPIALGVKIQEVTQSLLPKVLSQRSFLSDQQRREIAEVLDDWQWSGGTGQPPEDLSKTVVSHRPLWLASILGSPKRIPLHDALFDLVIFDEASQCDIATAIPLLARARRAVVVGDDLQLSFIPQLSQPQDRNLMQAQGLPVSRMGRFAQSSRSLFDFASRVTGAERITLRHQYRSAGPIVDYISSTFYAGVLETSYDPKSLVVPQNSKPGLVWEDVPAPPVASQGNTNLSEVKAIVRHLEKLLVEEDYAGSIGVVTPFRSQVMELEAAISKNIPEIKRIAAELKVGTVDGFQGQERDLILFSPVIGPRSPQSGLTFFQRDKRRLNVAISRARAVAIIFGDLNFARSGKSVSLQRLASWATEPRKYASEGPFDSGWERKVYHALKDRNFNFEVQYEIAGRRLDFAVFGANGVKLDLEVDGRKWHQTPDGRRKTQDLWRDEQLKALGWRVRRFWVDELAKDMEGCLDRVQQDLS